MTSVLDRSCVVYLVSDLLPAGRYLPTRWSISDRCEYVAVYRAAAADTVGGMLVRAGQWYVASVSRVDSVDADRLLGTYDHEPTAAAVRTTARDAALTDHSYRAADHPWAPIQPAEPIARRWAARERLSPEQLLADPQFAALAYAAAEAGRSYSHDMLAWEKKDIVTAAVAQVRAAIDAQRAAARAAAAKAEKDAARAAKQAARRKEANPKTATIPPVTDETLALLIARLGETPEDPGLLSGAADRWVEVGETLPRAKAFVARLAAAATTALRLKRASALLHAEKARAAKVRAALRSAAGCGGANSVPITVVSGDAAPVLSGQAPYSTFRNGGVCQYPGAAKRAGYKIVYHADTRVVTVGAEYVFAQFAD